MKESSKTLMEYAFDNVTPNELFRLNIYINRQIEFAAWTFGKDFQEFLNDESSFFSFILGQFTVKSVEPDENHNAHRCVTVVSPETFAVPMDREIAIDLLLDKLTDDEASNAVISRIFGMAYEMAREDMEKKKESAKGGDSYAEYFTQFILGRFNNRD